MRISEICEKLFLEFIGDDKDIHDLQSFENANEKSIVFFENTKLTSAFKQTKAGAVLVSKKHCDIVPKNSTIIISENPHLSFAYISKLFSPKIINSTNIKPEISSTATIMPNVFIGNGSIIKNNVTIMHGAYIGENVVIEQDTLIHPNVVIYNNSKIGKRCHLQASCVIGSDGFGYTHTKNGEHIKIYHFGNVVLEDDVEVGANSTIDRGVFNQTLIKQGTKIDNLVQIGHNCKIGENCIIVSQAGIAGSSTIGKNVVMGGQSAIVGHIEVGDFATIAARAGVSKSLEGGKVYSGFPIMVHSEWLRMQAKIAIFFKKDKR